MTTVGPGHISAPADLAAHGCRGMTQDTLGHPMVVISRRVQPAEERRFRRWLNRLCNALERAPGYMGSTVHPPDETHPGQWVVIYQFSSDRHLDNWLRSAERAALIAESERYLADRPIEQRIVQPCSDSVTLISSVRLRAGTEAAHRRLHQRAVDAAAEVGGLVRHALTPAVAGAQPETVAMLTFRSRADLDRWMSSPQRREILDAMAALSETQRTINVVGGYAGWFPLPGNTTTKRWKQAVAVLIGLVPVSLLITALRQWIVPELPLVAAVLTTAVINVVILTYVVMPSITRVLRRWLTT